MTRLLRLFAFPVHSKGRVLTPKTSLSLGAVSLPNFGNEASKVAGLEILISEVWRKKNWKSRTEEL